MKFLNKHKATIVYWIIFLSIVLYFTSGQSEYYLDQDVSNFKKQYLHPILIWTFIIISVGTLTLWIIKAKSIKNLLTPFFFVTLALAGYIFLFQNMFLATSLFINRQFKKNEVKKTYTVNYLQGTDHTKSNFFPIDIENNQPTLEEKLINRLYKIGLKQNDTITLKFVKGIFGIEFQPEKFADK